MQKSHHVTPPRQAWILLAAVIVIGVSRHIPLSHPSLYNFSPVLAIFLVSGAFLKGKSSWLVPMPVVLLSDMLINPTYGASLLEPFMIVSLLSYGIIFFMGKKAGSKSGIIRFSCGYGISSALLFHSLTCSFAWWTNPFYAKNLTGLVQALTLGEPGYAPAYLFLRNSILSSVFFSVLFHWVATYELKKFKSEESKRLRPKSAAI